jgi:hypothetical protein
MAIIEFLASAAMWVIEMIVHVLVEALFSFDWLRWRRSKRKCS